MARRSNAPVSTELPLAALRPRVSATDSVYESLREAILSCALAGGTPLIEATLAAQFGVSKTPVREALQRLAHSGLVDMELARGATVHTLTLREIRDISELRSELEPMALRQSIPHMTDDDLHTLRDVLQQARQAIVTHDYQQLSILNSQFHSALYKRTPNQLLTRWLESLGDRRRLISMQGWALENRSSVEWEEHSAIVDALEAGDTDAAVNRLRDHIQRFARIVLEPESASEVVMPL